VKKLSILLTLCIAAAGVAFLAANRRGDIPEMTVRALDGTVTLVRDGEELTVDGDESLEPGDLIDTGTGTAELRLRGDRKAWLQHSTEVAVIDEMSLNGLAGNLRARAAEEEIVVQFDGIEAHATDAHFRIDQGIGSARAASYDGDVRLSKPGEPRLTVGRLFEAEVPAADLPTEPRPYRFDTKDEWDADILESVIDLDERLTQLGSGLASQLGNQRPGLDYFGALADRKVAFMKGYLKRSTDDLLIGFTVARNSAHKSLARSFRAAMSYRDDGGRWGIVASIMEAKQKALVADLQSVIVATGAGGGGGAAVPEFSVATASEAADTTISGPGGGALGSTGGPGDGDGGGGGGNGDGGGVQDCDTIDCAVKDVQDQLPDPDPTPTDPPDDDDDDGNPLTSGIIDKAKP